MNKVERFLDEEELVLERLALEKKKYMSAPESHRDYNREWERFYNYKKARYGDVHSSYLHDEWVTLT